MSNLKNAVRLTVKIEEARDAMKGLFGSEYAEKSKLWKDYIRAAMKKHDCSAIAAILHVDQAFKKAGDQLNGVQLAMVLSAAADVTEEAA